MQIYVEKNYDAVSRRAANLISAQVILKPDSVLGLATGSSPIGTYKQLVEWYNKNDLDFSKVRTVNLDEYVGLPKEDEHSYHYFMNDNLFSKVDIKPENVHLPNGMAKDIDMECKDYDDLIALFGGADLKLLGLIGVCFSFKEVMLIFVISLFFGLVLGLFKALINRSFFERFKALFVFSKNMIFRIRMKDKEVLNESYIDFLDKDDLKKGSIHYSLPILLAVVTKLIVGG